MPACALEPAVESPISERLEWLTDVLPSYNGKEQRIRLRGNPRRRFDFAFALGDDAARARAENFLTAHHGTPVDMPVWHDRAPLASALYAGATSIPVDTANRDFVVGGQVALVNNLDIEVATIAAIGAGSLTVSALGNAWPVGTLVAPARSARMEARVGTNNPWPAVMRGRVQFICEAGWAITAAAESADYLGYAVKIPDSTWVLDGSTDWERELEMFDPAIGNRAVYDNTNTELPTRQYRIALPTRADIWNYYAWLAAREGRLKPFWLSSGQKDMTPVSTIGPADVSFSVVRTGYADIGGLPAGRRDIVIETTSGQKYYRRIVAAAVIDADTEQITINSSLGVTLAPFQVARVSFMRFARLATDSVEIAHHWEGAADSKISFKTLRDDL